MIRSEENLIGARAFLAGVIIALLAGLFASVAFISENYVMILGILVLLGIVQGFFVAQKDVQTFLLASVSVVIVCYMGASGLLIGAALTGMYAGKVVNYVLQAFLALFVPATIVVALKTVFSIAKS